MHFGNEDGNGIFVFSNVPNGVAAMFKKIKFTLYFQRILTFS
jgi:hypothetical protein